MATARQKAKQAKQQAKQERARAIARALLPQSSQTLSRSASLSPEPNALQPTPMPVMYTPEDLVTLLVGDKKEKLIVYGHCLASSEFFTAAPKKEWKEGQTRTIELPEDDTKTVTQYLDFIYKGLLVSHSIQHGNDLKEAYSKKAELQLMLCQLYIFGERVLHSSLRNAIVKEHIRLMALKDDNGSHWYPNWISAKAVYEGTPANSPMRRLMIDILLGHGNAKWLDGKDLSDCPELLIDVIKEYANKAQREESPKDFRYKILKAEDYFV